MKQLLSTTFLFFSLISFLQAQQKVQTIIQQGHGESVKAVALSTNGKYLLSASRDQTIKLWDVQSAHEIRTFSGHTHTVNSIDFAANDKHFASGSADKTAKVWELATGKQVWSSPEWKQYVTTVALHPTRPWVAVGGYDLNVKVWDWKKDVVIAEFKVNPDRGTGYGVHVDFSPDGNWLAIGQDNRLVQVYATHDWEEQWTFQPSEGRCGGCGTLVAFSPDSKFLLRANRRAGLVEFDVITGKQTVQFKQTIKDLGGINYHSDGKSIALTTEDSLFIYNRKGQLVSAHQPSKTSLNDGVFVGETEVILAEDDGFILRYDIGTSTPSGEFAGTLNKRDFGGLAHDLSNYWEHNIAKHIKYKNEQLLIDNKWLLRGKMGTKGVLWNLGSGRPTHELVGHKKGVICFDYDQSTNYIFTGSGDGEIIRWDAKSGKELMRYTAHRAPVFDVVVSHNHKWLASTSWDGYIIVWDIETGKKVNLLYFDKVSGYELAFSLNDEYLLIGFLDKTLQLWDIASETKVKDFIGHTEIVTSIAVLDDEHFMSTAKDGRAFKWHMGYGLKKAKIEHPAGAIHAQLWLNNKQQVITAGGDKMIRLWNSNLTQVERTFIGHQNEVTALTLSADAKRLYSLDIDGVTKVWDLASGKEIYEFIQVSRSDWIIKSPRGFFNGTPSAMKLVHFVKGLKSYSLDQFFEIFYQPKAISDLLSLGKIKHRGEIEELMAKVNPPEVKLAILSNAEETEAHLYLKIMGKDVTSIQIQHNGKRLPITMEQLTELSKSDSSVSYKTLLPLVGGHNEFSCRAMNKNEIESPLTRVSISSKSTTLGTDCHIVAIGIDQYKNSALNLNYATNDAQAFTDSMKKFSQGIYRDIYTYTLYDEQANKANIEQLLDSLAGKITINDVFIFYYAGHGSMTNGHFYFITHETTQLYADEKRMTRYAISEEEMMKKFQQIKALKQVAVMDACHSGGAVEKLAHRGALQEKAIAQLSRSSGIHVLAAAGSEQFATEYDSLGHGLFTYCLLEALSGKADGAPADKKVTLFEIKSFLHDQVPSISMELKGSAQYPFTFSRGHDFPIVIEQKE
ncbi:MAG: caspase family protein [Flammeovirgaceae bacterium]